MSCSAHFGEETSITKINGVEEGEPLTDRTATVRNGTVLLLPGWHDRGMSDRKSKKKPADSTRVSVRQEMAKPRMARSARIAERNLDPGRVPDQPSITMPGTVNKIIPSLGASQPEKAQISVDGADQRHRYLRFRNLLTDENGDDVRLKKGAHVRVTVTEESKTSTTATKNGR